MNDADLHSTGATKLANLYFALQILQGYVSHDATYQSATINVAWDCDFKMTSTLPSIGWGVVQRPDARLEVNTLT